MTGKLGIPQLIEVASSAGWSGEDLVIAVAVALAESGGDPGIIGDVNVPHPGSASYGLWQINSYWHPEFGPDFTKLFDPQTNANDAYQIYVQAGDSFSPWSTYKSGAYQAYLSQVSSGASA